MIKKILIHIRTSIKLVSLISIATFLIIGLVAFCYKPIYSVTINGEMVGYSGNKSQLQSKINDYIENGEEENTAFVQIENLPEYKLCLLKRGIITNDDEIFEMVKSSGVTYYKYYAILNGEEEKYYVSSFEEAENIISGLKEKGSSNIDNISILEKYETEIKDFVSTEEAIANLYAKPVVVAATKKVATSSRSISTSTTISSQKVSLGGITLARPISGIITSRFGARSSIRSSAHTGLDIAASTGTPIGAAAAGTVEFSGTKGSYGKMVVISHGNGVQTYYGHCSQLYVSVGQTVKQGQTIAAVGSTGNSTGPHLHLEVRVNGMAYNPQNYVY